MAGKMTSRQLAGSIVMDEIAYQRMSVTRAADLAGLGRGTLYNVRDGKPNVEGATLRAIEGALGLPTQFLTYVIEGDRRRIQRLPSKKQDPATGIREDLRRYALDALEDLTNPTPQRRLTDHRLAN